MTQTQKDDVYIRTRPPKEQPPLERESIAMMANTGNETGPLQEEYICKAELARRLGKLVRPIEYWMWGGWLPYHKMGSLRPLPLERN